MESLNPGVLTKLLEDMDLGVGMAGEHGSAVLQVISIVPALSGSDFWPNQGFYLKVSDSFYATYVSLPHEEDEMILGDELQLGQFIYVENLERGLPVPVLRGVKPIPGRHPCVGCPKDIVSTTNLVDQASNTEKGNGVVKKAWERTSPLSASKTNRSSDESGRKDLNLRYLPTPPINFFSKCDVENNNYDILKELAKITITCAEQESDSDSSRSSCYSRKGPRRSWDGKGSAATRSTERSISRAAVKYENRPLSRAQSADNARNQFSQNDNSVSKDDHSILTSARKREADQPLKVITTSAKRKPYLISKTHAERSYSLEPFSLLNGTYNDRKWIENVSWASLPASLMDLGKEVLKQRDVAMVAAVEALQEAAAAERLIRCLRVYSQLQSIKEDNAQPMVNRFLNLHDDMIQARAIIQSLANIRTLRTSESDSLTTGSIKEAVQVTSERKKHAASWIKAAVASDLSPFPAPTKPAVNSTKAAKMKRKICSVNCSKPRGSCIINKQQKNGETQLIQAASEESLEWVKGSSLLVVADLANALQGECKRWFLNYVEKYLDDLGSKTSTNESESEIAGVLCQIKRVEDWLGVVTHNQDNQFKDGCALSEDEETQACGRVRKKIYSILLKHVESAARALENMSVAASDDL